MRHQFHLVLAFACLTAPSVYCGDEGALPTTLAEFLRGRERPEGVGELAWEEIVRSPARLMRPRGNTLLLRLSRQPAQMFRQMQWVANVREVPETELPNDKRRHGFAVTDADARYGLWVCLNTAEDVGAQVVRTAHQAFLDYYSQSARIHTLNLEGVAPEKLPTIPGANLVISLLPVNQVHDSVYFCIENVGVYLMARFAHGTTFPSDRLIDAAKLISELCLRVPERPASGGGHMAITVERGEEDALILKWSVTGGLADHWVRVDVGSGAVAADGADRVILRAVPAEGTTIRLYAISPDGKNWAMKELKIPSPATWKDLH